MPDLSSGVWVAYYNDYGIHVDAIFDGELEAYRWNEAEGGLRRIAFVPFGVEITAAFAKLTGVNTAGDAVERLEDGLTALKTKPWCPHP